MKPMSTSTDSTHSSKENKSNRGKENHSDDTNVFLNRSGLTNITSSVNSTHSILYGLTCNVNGSSNSTNSSNHVSKRHKSTSKYIMEPFQISPLSDITNVIGSTRQPGHRLINDIQTPNPTISTPNSILIDLNDDNLVDTTLTYGVNVPMEIVTDSSILRTVHDVIISNEKPKRAYKPRTSVTNNRVGITTAIGKSKRPYVRRNNPLNEFRGIHVGSGVSSVGLQNENLDIIESKKQPLPRKNICRRSRRSIIDVDGDVSANSANPSEYGDIGDASYECGYCHAQFWFDERSLKAKLQLKHAIMVVVVPLHGQNYHLIGGLLPEDGATPKFAQMYIYDTDNEVTNRKNSVRGLSDDNNLCDEIIDGLRQMLDDNNKLVKTFRMAKDRILESGDVNVRVRLLGKRRNGTEERTRDLPTCSEVAVLIVGDFDNALGPRDILVESRSGCLRRINELNVSYLALQYPLLLPYAEDGYTEDIPFTGRKNVTENGRKFLSVREFFAFRLHDRKNEASTILSSRRLFQQFIVDAYTMVETCRLKFVYFNQKKFRCDIYKGLEDAVISGDKDPKSIGKRIILPSSFTGGTRFMVQNYQDAMAICRSVGYPDLYITFTCNPNWPEIVRFLDPLNLRHEDRPDIVSRVFKIKLMLLIRDLRQNRIFGKVVAGCLHH
ncbi:hypothetical protein CASFOL_030792 [Castilleja foliolosa]|uniref:Helitron helicase-like domain-containing protein n=1 Tax=Castilleja foliolosa TaxID=1961234 RepID=A0ABD3C748_9LAMI